MSDSIQQSVHGIHGMHGTNSKKPDPLNIAPVQTPYINPDIVSLEEPVVEDVDSGNAATRCLKKTNAYLYHAFNDHPIENGMTYGQHFVHAGTSGIKSLMAGSVLLVHSLFPFIFLRTGSNIIKGVNTKLNSKIRKRE